MTMIARCLVPRNLSPKITKKEKLSKSVLWLHFAQGSPDGCTVGPKWGHWRVLCNHIAGCLVPRNLSPKIK